jgi:chlorobactene glucosyltransferase
MRPFTALRQSGRRAKATGVTALLLALPWVLAPLFLASRMRRSRTLDEEPAAVPDDEPLVSVVVPARNEAHNIERCARSALAARWPRLEVLVVDDHSTDGTGDIARRIAAGDPRLRVVEPAPLPGGWFGKPWACQAGFDAARGEIVCFVDADTWQSPDLLPRAVHAMGARRAGLLSVDADQELGSFWEKVVQPQIFAMLWARFGGTEIVNESTRVHDKIANGQCILVRREAYLAVSGHRAVRDQVAEDLMLAQRFFLAGLNPVLVLGAGRIRTRMYTSLAELVRGWTKNAYSGGREAMPGGRIGRALFPLALVLPALLMLAPPALLLWTVATGAVATTAGIAAAIATASSLAWWVFVYRWLGQSPLWAPLYPLGAAMLLWIVLRAIARGRRVAWKGREYVTR